MTGLSFFAREVFSPWSAYVDVGIDYTTHPDEFIAACDTLDELWSDPGHRERILDAYFLRLENVPTAEQVEGVLPDVAIGKMLSNHNFFASDLDTVVEPFRIEDITQDEITSWEEHFRPIFLEELEQRTGKLRIELNSARTYTTTRNGYAEEVLVPEGEAGSSHYNIISNTIRLNIDEVQEIGWTEVIGHEVVHASDPLVNLSCGYTIQAQSGSQLFTMATEFPAVLVQSSISVARGGPPRLDYQEIPLEEIVSNALGEEYENAQYPYTEETEIARANYVESSGCVPDKIPIYRQ